MRPVLKDLLLSSLLWVLSQGVVLETRLGQIEGEELNTPRTGRTYYSFTGIPYAQPPVGSLRLRNPVPHNGWTGTLDATKPAPICTQSVVFVPALRNQTFGQEDCLYLNVYTPTLDKKKKLPVLIYVHGGGFRCGSSGTPESPTHFMEKDAVLVFVHYRLGALGFLSTEDSEIPGNFGLKDQAMAIKWISENIDEFGGDPSLITVFGESAGGASVHYLITSPLSRGYLKGGIAESGLTDAIWALAETGDSRKLAKRVAEVVGCNADQGLLECFQNLDAEEFVSAEKDFLVWDFDPAVVFKPVIEVKNDGAFMTEDPRSIEVTKPFITGINSGEGIIKTASLHNQDDSVTDFFVNNFEKALTAVLGMSPEKPRLSDFIAAIKERYFKDLSNRQSVMNGLEDLYEDLFFVHPLYKTMQRHAGPLYVYLFDHRAECSMSELAGSKKLNHNTASHADELLSLFNRSSVFPEAKGREEDRKVSDKLVDYWYNFAKYQNPTPTGSKVIWKDYSDGAKILHIKTNDDTLEPLGRKDMIKFWNEAFDILRSTNVKTEL